MTKHLLRGLHWLLSIMLAIGGTSLAPALAAAPTATITGRIAVAGNTLPVGTTITLTDAVDKTQTVQFDASGEFSVTLPYGEYALSVADRDGTLLPNSRHLSLYSPQLRAFGIIELYQGDCNGDGRIDVADAALLLNSFGPTSSEAAKIDYNRDGTISEADLEILCTAFNKTAPAPAQLTPHTTLENFITRDGDKLMDGDEEFRFISFATANLFANGSQTSGPTRFPDEYEMRDSFNTIVQLGGKATRPYTLAFRSEINSEYDVHVEGPGQYNETAFVAYDLMLKVANETGVRLILPIINHQNYLGRGGVESFEKMMGDPFFTGEKSKAEFKRLLDYLLNRTNTFTGVKYKDDPAILAWQMGNELQFNVENIEDFYAWESEMAGYIKSIDKNHLIATAISVEQGQDKYVSYVLEDPNFDIVDVHYYEAWTGNMDLSGWLIRDKRRTAGKKAFVVSEFGLGNLPNMDELMLAAVIGGTSGMALWGLRHRNRGGGFYYHTEMPDTTYRFFQSYHWPGFAEGERIGEDKWLEEEVKLLALLRKYAYLIRGADTPPPLPVPAIPTMLDTSTFDNIRWQGTTGARYFIVERAQAMEGPFMVIADNVRDVIIYGGTNTFPLAPYFSDTPPESGTYYYRVSAVNESGRSQPSNIIAISQ